MEWNWLPDGEGYIAAGRRNAYLISVDLMAGRVTGVRLTRWQSLPNPVAYETALEAVRNVIILPLDPPRAARGQAAAALLEGTRRLADRYESGDPLPGRPAWQ